MGHIETERRFIIKMPPEQTLSLLGGDSITQIYIESDAGTSERVRARRRRSETTYTHTVKRRIGPISAEEDESVIDEAEFLTLSERREPGTRELKKTRYMLPYRGHIFEIDVYPEWRDIAMMEVELTDEEENVSFPPEAKIIKEVSGDRSLSNHALSRSMPDESELLSDVEK